MGTRWASQAVPVSHVTVRETGSCRLRHWQSMSSGISGDAGRPSSWARERPRSSDTEKLQSKISPLASMPARPPGNSCIRAERRRSKSWFSSMRMETPAEVLYCFSKYSQKRRVLKIYSHLIFTASSIMVTISIWRGPRSRHSVTKAGTRASSPGVTARGREGPSYPG